MVRDTHLAEDVTQAVFILLAQKAGSLRGHSHLTGWLFRTTRYCGANTIKRQARRRKHERKAGTMQAQQANDEEASWELIFPLLDEAIEQLGGIDREAVLLRFHQGRSMADVGAAVGLSEEAAKKRVQRAVRKLREIMASKGVPVEAGGLTAVIAANIAQAAPVGLVHTTLVASGGGATTAAGTIAHSVARLMWWAKVKMTAILLLAGSLGAGAGFAVVHYTLASPPTATTPAVIQTDLTPERDLIPERPADPGQREHYDLLDSLYENAPCSKPGLSMKVGPNTFTVTAVVRYRADGTPVATDGSGAAVDPGTLPLTTIKPSDNLFNDTVIVFLTPGRDRYEIKRLRIFDHFARRFISDVVIRQVPGLSAFRIEAAPGTLPRKIDLWLDLCSYSQTNVANSLPTKKNASVTIGQAVVGFQDIRDGQWDFDSGSQTTLQLKATNWNLGRYQIAAVSNSGAKCMSDFFFDLSGGISPTFYFPFGLDELDHLELRSFAHEPPFFFDGVELPTVGGLRAGSKVPQATIVDSGGNSSVKLPCGAVVELRAVGLFPPSEKNWWGLDGQPAYVGELQTGGSVSDANGTLVRRMFVGGLLRTPRGVSDLMWQFDSAVSYAGDGSDQTSIVVAALKPDVRMNARLGVASTPWYSIEEIAPNHLPAQVNCVPGLIESIRQTQDGVSLNVAMTSLPENVRLVLVDRAKKSHRCNGSTTKLQEDVAPWGLQATRMSFSGLRCEDVQAIRFETRNVEFASFENVPVNPK